MDLRAERTEAGIVIHVAAPRIDAAEAIAFKDRMKELTDDADGRVVLDLGEVTFIDSSGLGAVVAAMKQLAPGQKLELAALTPAIDKVLRLTRMDTVFRIHASVEAAREALQRAG
jgi:anti-sigma B factor antagonist